MRESRQLRDRPSANAAFSLIELLLVVAILVILTTLFWGGNSPKRRDRELASCRQNLERIYLAMEIYAHDNKDRYPVVTNAQTAEDALAALVPHYTSDTGSFLCPASGDTPPSAAKSTRDWRTSYAYYMGRYTTNADTVLMSDKQVDTESKDKGYSVFSVTGKPPGNNHGKGGGNFLMCDGSVVASGNDAPFPLRFSQPVVLLNPNP